MSSSSSVRSLRSLARKEIRLPFNDSRLDRQLPAREPERLLRQRLWHAGELEHDTPGLDHRDPVFRRALPGAHPGLGGLLRHRLVRENVDPDLAPAADLACHRDSRRLDLAIRHPAVLERLQTVVAGLHSRLALREAAPAASLVLAELRFLRKQHLALVVLLGRPLGSGLCLGGRSLLRSRLPRGLGLLGARVARLVEFGRVLVHLLLRRRVRCIGNRRRRLLDLRLDRGLLTTLRRDTLFVGARLLDVLRRRVLLRTTRATALAAAAARAALAHRPEPFAVGAASPAALAALAKSLCAAAAAPCLVLLAKPGVALLGRALVTRRHDLALVDPDFDTDPAGRRLRLGEAVVDVRADRVQRHTALGVAFRAAHLAAAEPAAALNLDALRARPDRRGERPLHRAPEADPVLELLRDRLRDELRVELGPLDLVDVDVDGLAGHPVDVLAQRVDLDARLADHDPRPSRIDVDRDPLCVLADQDVRQAGVRQLVVDVLADADVLLQEVREVLVARVPV